MTKLRDLSGLNLRTIVHLLPHFRNNGNGVVNAAVDLACSQAGSGFRVACVCSEDGAFADLLRSHGVTAIALGGASHAPRTRLSFLPRLHAALAGLDPLIVHAHTVPTALGAKALQPLLGFALVATAHNEPSLKGALLGVSDRIVCVSAAVAEGMRRLGIPEAKLRVVHNGPLGSPRRPLGGSRVARSGNCPSIITVGGLQHAKGVQDLIAAFSIARRAIPNLTLRVLGDGPASSRLRQQAARLGCEKNVCFLGFIEDPGPHLASADVFVLPSHQEAFGLALAEAREAGCAIIGTRVGGIPEVLENGQAGILVPARDPRAISQELVKLLTDGSALKDWQERARANLDWLRVERVSREMLAVYDSIVNELRSAIYQAKGSSPII